MSNVPLTFACGLYDRMLALYTGDVAVEGVDLNFLVEDDPRKIFDRMAARQEFDVCEFSSSEFISRFAADQCPFVALPVFASRVFRHGFIYINTKHIKSPKDLEGKRIGVPRYTMTAALFQRGLIKDEYGVDFSNVAWIEGDINTPKQHGSPTILPTVRPVSIKSNESGKSLSRLLADGDIQALIGTGEPDSFGVHPDVARLYPDFREAEKEYYKRTRIFPIMHLVAIRKDTYEKHPFIAASLYKAFVSAKAWAQRKMSYGGTLRYTLPWMLAELEEIKQVFGGDPWPYGIEPNRPTLEALVRYMVDQGLIDKPVKIDDLFVPTQA
jgi:4,5-dihydroxyphthalate decarboxylase